MVTSLAINLLRWSTPWDELQICLGAVLDSDLETFTLTYTENPHPTAPSLVEEVRRQFGKDPRLRIVLNLSNLGYAGAHNKFFVENDADLLMVLNPDAILGRTFLSNIIKPFADPAIGAATGKMIKPYLSSSGERILDGTGIELYRSRRARERGQLEPDRGQYDRDLEVFGVSGTAAVYRRKALEAVRLDDDEYFDTDFFAYWEDFDLSWRLRLRGFGCIYVPQAEVEHGRAIGVSPGGLRKFSTFVRHHRAFPLQVRRWSWRNHMFAILKNDHGWSFYRDLPRILLREFGMFLFLLVLIPDTLTAIPETMRLLPTMLRKRALIRTSRIANAVTPSLLRN